MSLSGEIATVAIKVVGSLLGEQLRAKNLAPDQDENRILECIEAHLEEVVAWSEQVQFFGMNSPASIQSATIALDIYAEPRRFRALTEQQEIRTERDLLTGPNHYLLLGEPGSGKTTTLKRLARSLLTEPPESGEDVYEFPLVIRLRELSEGESLYIRLAKIFGLKYVQHEVVTRIEAKVKGASSKEIRHFELRIGDRRIEDVVQDCLNRTRALLLLDGLDEVKPESLTSAREELVHLGRHLRRSKIVLSCRSGDYNKQMDGFAVLEMCPLSSSQIKAIKDRWLGRHSDEFLRDLRQVPYYDLADRPLLLTQMLFIYKRYGYLPEQPSMIYRKVLRLLLEEWDAEREIARRSKYAGFDPDRKAEFLAALSYHLTYCMKEKSFSEDDLVKAYLAVYRPFNLPATEAREVAREIQSHTGIVLAGPHDSYEFCHLSIQEYLCANYLVRSNIRSISKDIAAYSAPLAVAVSLSSKPGYWLGALILEPGNLKALGSPGVASLLSRLLVERPFFEVSEPLGFAIIRLIMDQRPEPRVISLATELLRIDAVLESVAKALRWYNISLDLDSRSLLLTVRLRRGFDAQQSYQVEVPTLGAIPGLLLPELLAKSDGHLEVDAAPGRPRSLGRELAVKIAETCLRQNE
jgi:DNA polymerase III delta prime subunit